MYRFRTIENLLGNHKELENQEIYFAPPEDLNDPMEGYMDFFWKGDKIIWRNFIANYVRSVELFFSLAHLVGVERKLNQNDIVVPITYDIAKRLFRKSKLTQQIVDKVFEIEFISDLVRALAERDNKIRRDELISYLELIHIFVINSVSEIYYDNEIIEKQFLPFDLDSFSNHLKETGNLVNLTNRLEHEAGNIKNLGQRVFLILNRISQQTKLSMKYKNPIYESSSNWLFLISEFPSQYISQLELMTYPPWYSASFLDDCTNSAIWAHYGNKHKGVCLKFKTTNNNGQLELNLETEHGYSSGPIIGMIPLAFKKIIYENKYVEIDFFKSLARMDRYTLKSLWYSDELGNISSSGAHLDKGQNEDKWRDGYWDNLDNSLIVKLKEWSFENEYRLIILGEFIDYHSKEKRKLKYDFNDLEGIIFGMKTDDKDKMEILKIIESKCKEFNRNKFDFYQAYYSSDSGKIESYKLNFMQFN